MGSVIAQTDDTQTQTTLYGYSPFGEATQVGEGGNSLQYTGRENDDTGLYYYRARYYDPQLKRFISEDPIGLAGGINSYAYVKNNPLLFVDPTGEAETAIGRLMASLCVAKQCDAIRRGVGGGARSWSSALGDCISDLNAYSQTHPGELEALQAVGISLGNIASECADRCSRLTSEPNFKTSCQNLGCVDNGQSGA